jgi:hypothetical protein
MESEPLDDFAVIASVFVDYLLLSGVGAGIASGVLGGTVFVAG